MNNTNDENNSDITKSNDNADNNNHYNDAKNNNSNSNTDIKNDILIFAIHMCVMIDIEIWLLTAV